MVAINFTFVPVCKLVASVMVIAFEPVPEIVEATETISPCDAPPPASQRVQQKFDPHQH